MKKIDIKSSLFIAALCIVAVAGVIFILDAIYRPFFVTMFDADYKEAEKVCESIAIGTPYEEVREKFKDSIVEETAYINPETGAGILDLKDTVKRLETNCRIDLENFKVIKTSMGYVWL